MLTENTEVILFRLFRSRDSVLDGFLSGHERNTRMSSSCMAVEAGDVDKCTATVWIWTGKASGRIQRVTDA